MKAKRRHELKENSLAHWIGEFIEENKTYLIPIAIAVLALPLIYLGVQFFNKMQLSQAGEAWKAYYSASAIADADERYSALRAIAVNPDYQSDAASAWAQQGVADQDLRVGSVDLFNPLEEEKAVDKLNLAVAGYENVLNRSGVHPMLQRRARYGLAQAYEALSNPEEAAAQYRLLADKASDTAIGKEAARRLRLLETADGKGIRGTVLALYEGFKEYDPSMPGDAFHQGLGEDLPVDVRDLPDVPSLSFPGSEGVDPVESTDPTEPKDPVETTDPTEPKEPAEPKEDPAETTDPAEPKTDPVDPKETPEPTEPKTDPAEPATEPVEPTEPKEPEAPAEPATEPAEPAEPSDSTEPSETTEPAAETADEESAKEPATETTESDTEPEAAPSE